MDPPLRRDTRDAIEAGVADLDFAAFRQTPRRFG